MSRARQLADGLRSVAAWWRTALDFERRAVANALAYLDDIARREESPTPGYAEVEEWKRLAEAASGPGDDNDETAECVECGTALGCLEDGLEPTPLCHQCAQAASHELGKATLAILDERDRDKAELAKLRNIRPLEGHDAPCHYCGKPTDSWAANPSLWPIPLCHADDPGVVKRHHIGCVEERLRERDLDHSELVRVHQQLRDAADLARANSYHYATKVDALEKRISGLEADTAVLNDARLAAVRRIAELEGQHGT